MRKLLPPGLIALAALLLVPSLAQAEVDAETAYVLNTFSFLVNGALVMWMAAGFTMLEAGMVRTKSVATICLKNIVLFSIAGIAYYLVGYDLMYDGVSGGVLGSFSLWSGDDTAALAGSFEGYAAASDWFFQMVFVATAASIVSGAVAERIKLWPFLAFTAVLTAVIYPIQGAWQWGGGWLSEMGFYDFAGSTIVHSTGGWAALTGVLILGARAGKYGEKGEIRLMAPSSLPLSTLGTFILWLGWFGFNGGSQLALGSGADAIAMANIYANTCVAAMGGVVVAAVATQLLYRKVDLTMVLNGALAGLVSITAGPDTPSLGEAILIGGVGAAIVVAGIPLLDRLRIDDVVGAVPVHLFAGIWGTLAVPLTNPDTSFLTQLTGVVAIGAFVAVASSLVWLGLKATVGLRVSAEDEETGLDKVELGMTAYPEFGRDSIAA